MIMQTSQPDLATLHALDVQPGTQLHDRCKSGPNQVDDTTCIELVPGVQGRVLGAMLNKSAYHDCRVDQSPNAAGSRMQMDADSPAVQR